MFLKSYKWCKYTIEQFIIVYHTLGVNNSFHILVGISVVWLIRLIYFINVGDAKYNLH